MPLVFSNKQSPLNAALNNKKSSSPLSALSSYTPFQFGSFPGVNLPQTVSTPQPQKSTPVQQYSQPIGPTPAPKVQTATKTQPVQSVQTNNDQPLIDLIVSSLKDYTSKNNAPKEEKVVKSSKTQTAPLQPIPSYSGILTDLIKKANEGSKQVQDAQKALTDFQGATAQKVSDIRSQAIPLEFQQGRAQVVQQASAEKEKALQTGVQNALTSQQQQLNALGTAAGLAAPTLAGFNQQAFNPLTGTFSGGGSLNDQVNTIAQRVKSGAMSYDDGVSALSGYGQGGVNALNTALGSGFDTVGSNASAAARTADITQTGTTGGQTAKAASSALQALDTLQNSYNSLGSFTGASGIPFINQLTQNVAMQTGVGREAVSAYQGALKEARAQINAVLAPIVGVDSANTTSNSLLPDNMLPSEIPQKIKAAKEYINQRVQAFTNPTQVGTNVNTGGSGGSLFAETW